MSTKLKNPHFLLLILSLFSLFFAYFVEYILDIMACPLCIYQRFPYLAFIYISIIALCQNGQKLVKYYIIACAITIIIATYHTGIERDFWKISSLCKPLVSISENTSIDSYKTMLYGEHVAGCSKPAIVIFYLSLTEWNLLLNLFLMSVFIIFRKWFNENSNN